MTDKYVPPAVWKMENSDGGQWSSINRPDSGSRYQQTLPKGKHPLQLYSMGTPNGQKVTIMLEELLAIGIKDAEYDAHLIRIGEETSLAQASLTLTLTQKSPH